MPREEARSFVDALENDEFADLMDAASAAGVATGTAGNIIYESAAGRLRAIETPAFPPLLGPEELLKRQAMARPELLTIKRIAPPMPAVNIDLKNITRRYVCVSIANNSLVVTESDVPPMKSSSKPTKRSRR